MQIFLLIHYWIVYAEECNEKMRRVLIPKFQYFKIDKWKGKNKNQIDQHSPL